MDTLDDVDADDDVDAELDVDALKKNFLFVMMQNYLVAYNLQILNRTQKCGNMFFFKDFLYVRMYRI